MVEQIQALLRDILQQMEIPELRKDVTHTPNLRWLQRNITIRNGRHPKISLSLELIKQLLKRSSISSRENNDTR